jgi:hypothetical protein
MYELYMYILLINIAVATKRNVTGKRIAKSSVGRNVAGIYCDCLAYDMKNAGEANADMLSLFCKICLG